MTNPYSLDPASGQSIGTSSDWTYQSTSPTPLSSTSFLLTPASVAGDSFCTDSFCDDTDDTGGEFDPSIYAYFRWTGVARPAGGEPIDFTMYWYPVEFLGEIAVGGMELGSSFETPSGNFVEWIATIEVFATVPFNRTGAIGGTGNPVIKRNRISDGAVLFSRVGPQDGSGSYDIGDLTGARYGVWQFTNDAELFTVQAEWAGVPAPPPSFT